MVSRSFFMNKRALVAGGLGFIGSNLARRLVDLGATVRVVDALLPNCGGNRANLSGYEDRIDLRIFDLCESALVAEAVERQDLIFNVAGRVSHLDSMTHPVRDMDANVRATIELLEAARTHAPEARLVFASTRQIYGRPSALPVAETHPLRPVDVNGVNKLAAEAFHTLYYDVYGMRTISLRLTNTFGPRMRIKDARQTFLGVWLRAAVEGRAFEVWGGQQLRDFSYIDDAVDAFLHAAQANRGWGAAYNVGGGPPLSLIDLAETLKRIHPGAHYVQREFPPERKVIDIGDYYADDSKFRALTGWASSIGLEEGLRRSFDFYQASMPDYV